MVEFTGPEWAISMVGVVLCQHLGTNTNFLFSARFLIAWEDLAWHQCFPHSMDMYQRHWYGFFPTPLTISKSGSWSNFKKLKYCCTYLIDVMDPCFKYMFLSGNWFKIGGWGVGWWMEEVKGKWPAAMEISSFVHHAINALFNAATTSFYFHGLCVWKVSWWDWRCSP